MNFHIFTFKTLLKLEITHCTSLHSNFQIGYQSKPEQDFIRVVYYVKN